MKKGMKLIAFILAAVVTVSSVLPANVYANTNVDDNTYVEESILAKQTVSDSQLKSELAELYQKCLQNSGKTSFHGWCGAFVGQQLNALGIDSKTGTGFNGNGNTWYPSLLDNVETNSGHTQKKYAGRDCLKSIAADAGDEPAYNIVVSFPNSTGSNTSYGHVIFIYAIVGNTAYYIESYGTSFGAEGTPIARDIDGLMNEYCSLYGTAQGAVWFSGGGGISYINDDEMFSKYPYYFNDDTYNAMFRNARSEIYDALDNADSSRMLIAIMTALSEGKDLIIKQLLSSVTDGIDSTSDEAIDKATLDFVQTMLGNETFLSSFITSAQSKIKGIKLGYDLFSATGKEAFSKEASTLLGVHKEVFDLQLSKFLDNTGKVTKITKYGLDVSKVVASAVEMEYINIEVVEQLKTLLIQYGYDNTELYEGISRLDAKLHLDITTRVFDTVANDAVLDILSEVGDTVFNALVSEDMGIAYAIVNVAAKASVYFFYEKLGNGIKLDDVLETYALYEFQDTLFALKTDMYMELLSGKADLSSAAENYELIWNAYRAGIVSGLNSACEITKSKSLKSVRENMKETLTGTFTYDKFLERCRAAAMQAVVNGNAVTVGSSNTDSNAESKSEAIVEKRLAKIIEMYPSGSSKFEMMYDNKKGSFAFTEFVFKTLYENIIDGTVASDKQYEYSRPYQTTKIGTLHGSEVSEDAIGILISKAKVGDVILGYGEKYGLHSMIFKEATDNGIVVYDSCWDKEKNGDYNVLLHEIPYTELAEWVENGTSESEGGLSLYHFISYNSLYKRNSEIQADDKENFIIDENGVLTGYKGYKTFVKIPDTVKAIGDNAFKNNDMIRNIYIPDSVTSIGENAFYDCDQLTSVFIPDSVTSVGSSCFYSCNNLTYAKLPQNMDVVSSNMFYECKKLETVVFGMNVTEIENQAFEGCNKLVNIKLPENLTEIRPSAFSCCKSLTEITIPKSLTDCNSYGDGIFYGCSNLKTINFEKGITRIPAFLFHGTDGLEEIDIPETVTTIGGDAFKNCKNLTTVTGMKNVTKIENQAFEGCNKLVNIKLPENLTEIRPSAFSCCKSLTEITIPKSLTDCNSYGDGIFYGCSNLKTINFEKGITRIPAFLFHGTDGLEEIDIPETVTTIGGDAFKNCKNLTTVTGMKNVTKIGDNAFYNCSNLKEITIPDTVENMGTSIFYGCTSLKSVVLPNKRVNITGSTFYNCSSLESITLPDTVEYIRNNAFYGCSSLKKIVWSKSIKEIENNAFKGCSSLTEIIIPDGVTSIGSNAFQNCTSLASVQIPNSVTSLGTYIFDGCSSLTDVTLGKGLISIPSYMFSNCESLKNIKIPYNVATIGSYAFLNDTAFTEITIPRKTTAINSNAFSYPGKLNIYGISGTYAETFANENNIKFTNREVNASKVELNESQITLNKGDTYNLIMSVTPDDFTDAVTWKSTDTDVVTVTETGVIKAVGTGTATIKLTVGNVSTSCRITVLQPVTSISLDRSSLSLDSSDNYQLSAYIYPSTASNKNVVWESSDPSVATVDDNGMVTALKKGTAKITVKAMDGSNVSASCTVTVKNTTYVCDTVDKIESQHNYENECSDSWIYTIEGAECIEVGFDERTAVESGFDYIYIFSADDTMVGQYTGTDLAGKTIRIEGPKVRIKLESDDSGNEWGFKVTSVKRASKSHMMELIPAKEATCIEEGNNSYYYCSECNKYFKDEAGTIETTISDEIIPVKKDHEYVNGYCKYCNKAQYEAGWKKTSTGWWYDNGDGTYPKNEWKYIDGKWYHFDERGYRQTGWKYIGSNWYFFNESGDMRTGWFTRYGKTYYCKPDGSMARQFVKVGSSTYYFDSEGALQTGWKQVGNKWYYMNSNGVVQTGWKQLGKNWYYLNSDGSMQTGWKQVGRYWYYMDGNGVMQTGWKQIGKNWYYMDSNGVMQTGWKYIGKNWYYMDGNGVMQTGWKTISGRRYYFYANGAMR